MNKQNQNKQSRQRGLTLVEVVVATMLTGMVALAALKTLGAATRASLDTTQRAFAASLAHNLLEEILDQEFIDRGENPTFGAESGEGDTTREDFDDVDDYHEWDASPPVEKDGTAIANGTGWRRKVIIQHVEGVNLDQAVSGSQDTGTKLIKVHVFYNDTKIMTLRDGVTSASLPEVE